MKWIQQDHDEGGDKYWHSTAGNLEADVSFAPWIDDEKPWCTEVYMGFGRFVLSPSRDASAAKAKARKFALNFAEKINRWAA